MRAFRGKGAGWGGDGGVTTGSSTVAVMDGQAVGIVARETAHSKSRGKGGEWTESKAESASSKELRHWWLCPLRIDILL